jgi:HSP20 family protein
VKWKKGKWEMGKVSVMAQLIPANWRRGLERLRGELHRAIDQWQHRRVRSHDREVEVWSPSLMLSGGPVVDLEETDDNIIVTAELPGLDKDDFTVEISGERLSIRGEKKQETEEQGREYYYAKRRYGAFARVVALPCEIDADKVKARYKNGV